jgi:hypothetical protein
MQYGSLSGVNMIRSSIFSNSMLWTMWKKIYEAKGRHQIPVLDQVKDFIKSYRRPTGRPMGRM